MTAPDLVEVVAEALWLRESDILERKIYGFDSAPSRMTYLAHARAVLAALTEAGSAEWGVVGGEHLYKFSAAEEKKARGFAALHEGTLNRRIVGPWTAVE